MGVFNNLMRGIASLGEGMASIISSATTPTAYPSVTEKVTTYTTYTINGRPMTDEEIKAFDAEMEEFERTMDDTFADFERSMSETFDRSFTTRRK